MKKLIIVVSLIAIGVVGLLVYRNNNSINKKDVNQKPQQTSVIEAGKKPNILIVSEQAVSPNGEYTMNVAQEGDGYRHSLTDKVGNVILQDHFFEIAELPGYNITWGCQCGGPEFKGWSSDSIFVLELRAQSMDGSKLHYYHMAADAATGRIFNNTFELVKTD